MRSAVGGTAAAAMQVVQVGDERQIGRAIEVLDEARRGLYRILAEEEADPEAGDE
jgi:hypothetical protein